MTKQRVVVGFSGGKDSTTAAIDLKHQGYDVHLLTMLLGFGDDEARIPKLQALANKLDMPLKIIDLQEQFHKRVVEYFLRDYAASLTPNPCAVCNVQVKFNLLLRYALDEMGAEFFATGHYADRECVDGKWFLKEPADRRKSQIYFLGLIDPEVLQYVLFPIAKYTIDQVRETVKDLPLVNKDESQDVCFLEGRTLVEYLERHMPEKFKEGDILDTDGNKMGKHPGAVYFTVGQRRGTFFAAGSKLYVLDKDVEKNTVTLGENERLMSDTVTVERIVFWRPVKKGELLDAKVRYVSRYSNAEILEVTEDTIRARFDAPVRAVTPGQLGVFYSDGLIVAAGFIR